MNRVGFAILIPLLSGACLGQQPETSPGRGLATAPSAQAPAPARERRVALIIGNNAYAANPLQNAENDARTMDAILRELGFSTEVVLNGGKEEMERRTEAFAARIRPGDAALFYYSGHGAQLAGANYLVPIDFRGSDGIALRNRSFQLTEVLERLSNTGAAFKFVFLDACRDYPFPGLLPLGAKNNAAQTDLPSQNFYIAFATSSEERASDGTKGTNGLFTGVLARALKEARPGESIETIMQRVNTRMGTQVPWIHHSMTASWYPRGEMQPVRPDQPLPPEVIEAARLNIEFGNREMVDGNYEEAVNKFSAAIRLNPRAPGALLARGLAYGILNRHAEEVADLTKAIELKPTDPVAFLSRALAYRRAASCANALVDLDKAISLKPDFAAAYRHRGECMQQRENTAQAEKDLARAVELDGRDWMAREMLADIRLQQGKPQEAAQDYQAVIQMRPSAPRAWRGLADAQEMMGDSEAAAKSRSMIGPAPGGLK